jgi:hypothetical protein
MACDGLDEYPMSLFYRLFQPVSTYTTIHESPVE